jgi:hypothetical protein
MMSSNNQLASTYQFCPIGGIVCSLCKYPIPTHYGYFKAISLHEHRCKNHSILSDKNDRVSVISNFNQFTTSLAIRIANALPDEILAKEILLEYIDPISKQYPYCSTCNALVVCKYMHKGKRHLASCKETRLGYASKFWTRKEPMILPCEFRVVDTNIFCSTLHDSLTKEVQQQHKCLPNSATNQNTKMQVFQQILSQREQCFEHINNSIVMRKNNLKKNPDLWLERTGWDEYLEGFNAGRIYDVSKQFNNDNEQHYIKFENKLEESIQELVEYVRRISRLNLIFYEVQRRPNTPYPRKPFRVPTENTIKRYISNIRSIFRVIIRIHDYQSSTNNIDCDFNDNNKEYPVMTFTNDQSTAIQSIKMCPDRKQNYINLLLSLAGQRYESHPYECTLICALAYLSLNADSTYKPAANFTSVYASIFTLYKVLIVHKSMTDAILHNGSSDESVKTSSIRLAKINVNKYLSHPDDTQLYPNAMSHVINIASYAFSISRNSSWVERS